MKDEAERGLQGVCEPGAALNDSEVGRKGRETIRYPALGKELQEMSGGCHAAEINQK